MFVIILTSSIQMQCHPDAMPLAEAPFQLRRQSVGLQQSRRKLPGIQAYRELAQEQGHSLTPMMKCLSLTLRGGIDEKGPGPITTEDVVDSVIH
eukprot:2403044-Amphidinium_carterae.1